MRRKSLMASFLVPLMIVSLLSWIPRALATSPESEWWMYRPSAHVDVNEHIENASTNVEASVGIGVFVSSYQENCNDWPFKPERDGLIFQVAATANTRKGVTYTHYTVDSLIDWIDLSSLGSEYIVTTEDDGGRLINLPSSLAVRFYGGPGCHRSAEYEKVWVSSNGFLSFDSASNSSYPKPIPNSDSPNTLLAVYWSDLDPSGGWIKYYISESLGLFAVEWHDVLNKNNGIRQTFEVIIWDSWNSILGQRGQNKFAFLYQSATWDGSAVAGIEDQEGYKGIQTGGLSGQSVYFQVIKKSAEIRRLKIILEKSDENAEIRILQDPGVLKGANLQISDDQPEPPWFADPLCDGVTLLISSVLAGILGSAVAGVIFEASLIGLEAAADYAQEFSPFRYEDPDVKNANTGENEAHVHAKAEGSWGWPVDASLGSQIYWVFNDSNTENHSIKITATLEYCYYNTNHEIFTDEISTSVDLSVFIAEYLQIDYSPHGNTNPASGLHAYHHGSPVTVNASANPGYTFQWWLLDETTTIDDNPITLTMDSNHTLYPHFQYIGSGGGGGGGGSPRDTIYSPTLFVWNGSDYVKEVTLDLHGDSDVTIWHTTEQLLVPEDDHYLLSLRELNESISHIDYVKLYAVDTEGEMYEHHLIYAVHNELENVKQLLLFDDDNRVNLGPSHIIDLKFNAPEIENTAYFIFKIQGYEPT